MKISKVQTTTLGAAISLSLLCFSPAQASQGERILKPSFYKNTPMGSVAWVPQAATTQQTKDYRRYSALIEKDCYVLPRRSRHYFVINHRNEDRQGEWSFASIRALFFSKTPRDFISLYRNNPWYSKRGALQDFQPVSSESREISASQFLNWHDIRSLSESEKSERQKIVQEATGGFHASVNRDGIDSWNFAHLLGKGVINVDKKNLDRIQIYNQRFRVTPLTNSTKPLLFFLSPGDAERVRIIIDLPNFRSAERVTKDIVFEPSKCD